MKTTITLAILLLSSGPTCGEPNAILAATPLCVVTAEAEFPEPLRTHQQMLRLLLKEASEKEPAAANPLQLVKTYTMENFGTSLGMPARGCKAVTVYEISMHRVVVNKMDTTRIVVRFLPGNHSGRTFQEALQQNLHDTLAGVRASSKAEDFDNWVKTVFLSDTYMYWLPCGTAVFDYSETEWKLAPAAIQEKYLELRGIKSR